MFAHDRSTPSRRRRGVVLVLILAMLGLLAVIGVTFATFTSQAQVGARFYAQAQYNPDPEQVFDYALSQLINDTNNPVSFIRGHSIKRDMYGNDAVTNGYLTQLPPAAGGGALRIGSILASPPSSPFVIVTNIPTGNTIPALSGLKFGPLKSGATIIDPTLPGWTLRLSPPIGSNLVPQTFEVVADDISGPNHVLTLSPADMASYTPPGPPMAQPAPGMPFVLDGRYLRAFNGSGMSGTPPNAPANYRSINPIYPNFLFNRPDPMTLLPSGYNDPNSPIAPHMDEDYDAPDLENWFLALQSADGEVIIPSFHRPSVIVYDPANPNNPASNDWINQSLTSRAKFLRPRKIDHPASGNTFPDLVPDPNTGKVTFDVDNDGDGVNDSVWVDLGYPVQRDSTGRMYKPLFAFMVLGLNGRLPLNTVGNLQRRAPMADIPLPGTIPGQPWPDTNLRPVGDHASHLGYSPNEIDPRYALNSPLYTGPAFANPTFLSSGAAQLQNILTGSLVGSTPIPGRFGEPEAITAGAVPAAGRSYIPPSATGISQLDYRDVDWDTADFFPPNDPESNDLLDTIGRVQLPSERIRKFVTPIDPSGNGRVMPFDTLPTQLFDFGKGSDRWGRVGFFMYFRPPGVHAPDIPGGATTVSQNQTNLLHGYEHYRDPVGSGSNENFMAMMPWDTSNTTVPTFTPPTMGMIVNSTVPPGATVPIPQGRYPGGSLNLQEADQLNLYTPTPYDAPFGPHDLEWLYRRDDVDGTNLTSRLSQLGAPVFNNTMTRRLFSVDSWELNTFAAANTAPLLANWVPPALLTPGVIPHLAHGHRKINLNYPLPHISATAGGVPPNEPVRQKWCQETYQMLKAILGLSTQPSGMTPDQYALELAALGQFVVNIVDFRDPDATMTQFLNYDLQIKPATTGPNPQPAGVQLYTGAPPNPSPLIQWGMEYNPIAINEVLAYQFTCNQGGTAVEAQRLFVELVNTLTQNEGSGGTACDLGLPGWGFLITQDNPNAASTTPPNAKFERPNTVTGQLDPNTIQTYWQPLNGSRTTPQALATAIKAMSRQGPGNRDYGGNDRRFFVMGSTVPPPSASTDLGTQIATQGTLPNELVQQIPKYSPGSGNADFFWLHLVRPANPLDPNSTKVVVDSMRFPYIDGGGRVGSGTPPPNVIYSVGRLQPYRGGQLVPGCQNFTPPYPYGFSDQVDTQTSDSASQSNLQGAYNGTAITNKIFHTLGGKRGANPNDSDSNEQNENWDYFPFFDRDFTSVAELLLVPGCPPGLFTKLFVERVSPPIPSGLPTTYQPPLVTGSGATPSIRWYTGGPSVGSIPDPGVFPYLVDAFYYSTPQNTAPTPLPPGFSNRVGWHKILEFFEVPSSVLGATGPADQGNNGDWFRQDTRPGLINLNLIIDEEVFFGLIDDPRLNSTYAFANLAAASAANLPPGGSTPYGVPGVPRVATAIYPASSPTPFAPSATYPISDLTKYPQGRGYFDGANNFMKSAFSDFLKLRHGGSGLVFSPVSAASAIWGPGPTFVSWPEKPFHSLAAPDINDTIMRPARLAAISGDQGVRQPTLQIPPRRLFQIPDAMPTGGSPPNDPAAETGSQYVAADGTTTSTLGNDHVFLSSVNPTGTTPPGPPGWNASLISPVYDSTGIILPPILPADPSLLGGATGGSDRRRHPYFRTELLQKVMNLSTVRTHQYAVWVTVGFFEVVEPGNPQLASLNPTAAIDQLGKEVGADAGTSVRYRAFFIVDRTKAHGFNPADPDDFRDCVVFRRRIE